MAIDAFILAAALAVAPSATGGIAFRKTVDARGGSLALGDVADLRAVPVAIRAAAASLVLVEESAAKSGRRLDHAILAARARARMPGLGPWLAGAYPGTLSLRGKRPRIAPIVAVATGNASISAGDKISTRWTAGKFTVERSGIAMQAAKPGQRFFVRTRDGFVVAECCAGEQ